MINLSRQTGGLNYRQVLIKLCGSLADVLHIISLTSNAPISMCIQRGKVRAYCCGDALPSSTVHPSEYC